MIGRALMLFTGMALCYSAAVNADYIANRDFVTTAGGYNYYRVTGYNVQPNRPGLWRDGCRTDDYYCMKCLEERRARIPFVEPNILRGHR